MLTLYEMTGALVEVRDFIDHDNPTEEQRAQAEEIMARLLDELIPAKVANYCSFVRSLKLEAGAFKEEEKRLAERRQVREHLVERLTSRLHEAMKGMELRKLQAGTFAVSIQANPPCVDVVDEQAVPEQFKIPQPPKLDRLPLLACLKAGNNVPGVRIAQGEHLRIR